MLSDMTVRELYELTNEGTDMEKDQIEYVALEGWICTNRSSGKVGFIEFNDGTYFKNAQLVYADTLAGGLPTVCKGITKYTSQYPVIVGERWAPEKCEAEEKRIVLETQQALQKCITRPVPQGVFDALTSHAHNFGWPRTCASASVSAINAGDLKRGCDLLAYKPDGSPNWSNVGNRFIQGLHNRRKAEREICLTDLR